MIPQNGFVSFHESVGIAFIENVNRRAAFARFRIVVRKRERKMKMDDSQPRAMTIATIIWSNIVRQQYLQGLSDVQLCNVLGITTRTLYNYRLDPSVLTMKQVQSVLDKLDIDMNALLLA